MHFEEPFTIVVSAGKDRPAPYTFHFLAHKTTSAAERLIDVAFYILQTRNHRVPEGDHVEIEVIDPEPWTILPDYVHVHTVLETSRDFVCFTGKIETVDEAQAMTAEWCVGTTFTLVTGKDFVSELMRDPDTFLDRMRAEHGIAILS